MAKLSKKKIEEMQKRMVYKPLSVWQESKADKRKEIMAVGEGFKEFISTVKTERMAVQHFSKLARKTASRNWLRAKNCGAKSSI